MPEKKGPQGKLVKKPLSDRVKNVLLENTDGDVRQAILNILEPAIKKAVVDVVSKLLTGRTQSNSGYTIGSNGYTVYSAAGRVATQAVNQAVNRSHVFQPFQYSDVTLPSRQDCDDVLCYLESLLQSGAPFVTVANLYDYIQVSHSSTANGWGWKALDGSLIEPTVDGRWRLVLPQPVPVK